MPLDEPEVPVDPEAPLALLPDDDPVDEPPEDEPPVVDEPPPEVLPPEVLPPPDMPLIDAIVPVTSTRCPACCASSLSRPSRIRVA